MPELQLVRGDHAAALLAFEQENRAYFAASVPDRGDAYFAGFAERHSELLAWQANGTDFFENAGARTVLIRTGFVPTGRGVLSGLPGISWSWRIASADWRQVRQ